jgi:type II secretory pathway component PulM
MGRKKIVEPEINHADIARLRDLIEREERLEIEMRQDLREAIKSRDKKLIREVSRLEDKNRRLIMWIGVVVIMVVIFGFWISRIGEVINTPLADQSIQNFDLTEATNNMQTTVKDMVKSIDEIKQEAKKLDEATKSATSSNTFKADTKLP